MPYVRPCCFYYSKISVQWQSCNSGCLISDLWRVYQRVMLMLSSLRTCKCQCQPYYCFSRCHKIGCDRCWGQSLFFNPAFAVKMCLTKRVFIATLFLVIVVRQCSPLFWDRCAQTQIRVFSPNAKNDYSIGFHIFDILLLTYTGDYLRYVLRTVGSYGCRDCFPSSIRQHCFCDSFRAWLKCFNVINSRCRFFWGHSNRTFRSREVASGDWTIGGTVTGGNSRRRFSRRRRSNNVWLSTADRTNFQNQ